MKGISLIPKGIYKTSLNKKLQPLLLMLPALVVLIIMSIFPLIYALTLSFRSLILTKPLSDTFVGFNNYINLLRDIKFWEALRRTLFFVSTSVGFSFFLGILIALLLNRNIKGKFIYRSLLIIPMVLPPIVIGFTFRFMYNYDFGVINYFLDMIGLSRITFLASSKTALPSIIIADIWQWTPFMILVFLSALEVIPEELYEAAKIDGASKRKIFFYVTLPLMKPVVVIALLIRIMDSFRAFDKIFIMTRGGPGESSQTLSLYIWKKGLSFFHISEAIAMSIILLIIILVLSQLFIKYMQKEEAI